MSLTLCTAEFMWSDGRGTGLTKAWLPSMVAEQLVASTKDGQVQQAPDQVPFIDTTLTWTNGWDDPVHLHMMLRRAARSFVTSNPNTFAIDDAWTWEVGVSPAPPTPTGTGNGVGGRVRTEKSYNPRTWFGHYFADRDDWTQYEEIGACRPGETLAFRYRCLFSTPGLWRAGDKPRLEAAARYVQLRLWSAPMLPTSI